MEQAKTFFALKENYEKQLKNILLQAENVIQNSPIKTGNNHPIFSFVSAISKQIFYNNIFELNANFKDLIDYNTCMKDLGDLVEICPERYNIVNPIPIRLARDPVLSFPWEPTRYTNCIAQIGSDVKESFRFQPNNHFAILLLPLGLTMLHNGNHSTACGIIKGEGVIEVTEIVDISCNCHDFYFNGKYICRKSDNLELYRVKKFECGVLFELGRLIESYSINFVQNRNLDRKVEIIEYKDKSWRIYERNHRLILHYYLNNAEGECQIKVFENIIIFTVTAESFGTSITNAAGELTSFVAKQYNIPLESVICYEHYLSDYLDRERINRIEFEVKDGVLCNPNFVKSELPFKSNEI